MHPGKYLIVGASSGIGLSICKLLLAQGHEVIALSRTQGELSLLDDIQYIPFDVMSDDFRDDMIPESLDGLVYCPGTINLKPFRSISEEQFEEEFKINCLGAVKSIKSCLKALKQSGAASVVLFSTVAVQQGLPFHASIAAAKGAVEGLTRALAAELAPDIRVNCIAPSLTDTPLASKLLSSPEKLAAAAQRHPLKRVGKPEDAAAMACFLLSEESGWISGQVIAVDGGMSALRV